MADVQEPPKTLLDHTLRTAPLNVVYGTAAATGLGATSGASSAVLRNAPAIPAAFQTATRTGVFSFAFFSIREYALIPLLTHLTVLPSPLLPPSPDSPPSPHTHNLLPTTLSGLLAGSAFSFFQRGPATPAATHGRAGITLALGCAVLQGIVNEADLIRIRMLSRGRDEERAGQPAPLSPSPAPSSSFPSPSPAAPQPASQTPSLFSDLTTAPHPSSPSFSDPGRETFSERSDRLIASTWTSLKSTLSSVAPLKRMEEGEYEKKLREGLERVEEEKKRVEQERRELEGLERMLEEVDRVRGKPR
ncbi:hypothetical protein JCM8547_008201 [Rhodosporidiobolus lusitaniae]